jgi:hypothetical protein
LAGLDISVPSRKRNGPSEKPASVAAEFGPRNAPASVRLP